MLAKIIQSPISKSLQHILVDVCKDCKYIQIEKKMFRLKKLYIYA